MKYSAIIALTSMVIGLMAFRYRSETTIQEEGIHWISFEEAVKLNKKEKRKMFIDFYTSWCGWCKRLTASVFSKPEFKKWADKNVVLLELDYPKRFKLPTDIQQQNANMQQSFRVTGFPTVWVFNATKDKTGNYSLQALGKTGYTPSVDEFISTVSGFIK